MASSFATCLAASEAKFGSMVEDAMFGGWIVGMRSRNLEGVGV